jgi:hypothetical protein
MDGELIDTFVTDIGTVRVYVDSVKPTPEQYARGREELHAFIAKLLLEDYLESIQNNAR